MTTDKEINAWLDEQDITVIIPDGYPEAFLGVTDSRFEAPRAIYSEEGILKILMDRDGMSREDALEFYEVNVVGAFIENGPLYLTAPES